MTLPAARILVHEEKTTSQGSGRPIPLGLIALVLVRWIVVILMIKGFPPLESHDGFYFHHGGDQDYYFEYGRVLAQGSFDRYFSVNLGQPALMAIAIRIFNATTFTDILPTIVAINGFLFGGLSVILVGCLAERLAGSSRAGYLAAGLWALMPWIMWIGFLPHPSSLWLQAPYVPGVAWLQGIPDGPAVFFALLALHMLVVWIDVPRPSWLVASGTALGVMLLFRFQLVFIAALVLLVVMLERRMRSSIGLVIIVALTYLPQVIYNRVSSTLAGISNVIAWLPGYLYSGFIDPVSNEIYWRNPEFNILIFVPGHTEVQWLSTPAVWIVGAVIIAFVVERRMPMITRRVGWSRTIVAIAAPLAAIGAPMLSPIFLENVFRFSLPAIPFLALLAGLCGDVLWGIVHRMSTQGST